MTVTVIVAVTVTVPLTHTAAAAADTILISSISSVTRTTPATSELGIAVLTTSITVNTSAA